jgi:hypothetical protein
MKWDLKKSITSAMFEPATLGSSGKHTNHYITEVSAVYEYWNIDIFPFKSNHINPVILPSTLTNLRR